MAILVFIFVFLITVFALVGVLLSSMAYLVQCYLGYLPTGRIVCLYAVTIVLVTGYFRVWEQLLGV